MKDANLIYDKKGFVIDCKNPNKVDWSYISIYQKLSEPFIEKYKDKVNWFWISVHQKLSEPSIEKYKNKVIWYNISRYQKLSEPFIEKYKNKINLPRISEDRKECEVSLCLDCGFTMLENWRCQNCLGGNFKILKMTYKEFQNLPDFPEKEDLVEFLI